MECNPDSLVPLMGPTKAARKTALANHGREAVPTGRWRCPGPPGPDRGLRESPGPAPSRGAGEASDLESPGAAGRDRPGRPGGGRPPPAPPCRPAGWSISPAGGSPARPGCTAASAAPTSPRPGSAPPPCRGCPGSVRRRGRSRSVLLDRLGKIGYRQEPRFLYTLMEFRGNDGPRILERVDRDAVRHAEKEPLEEIAARNLGGWPARHGRPSPGIPEPVLFPGGVGHRRLDAPVSPDRSGRVPGGQRRRAVAGWGAGSSSPGAYRASCTTRAGTGGCR